MKKVLSITTLCLLSVTPNFASHTGSVEIGRTSDGRIITKENIEDLKYDLAGATFRSEADLRRYTFKEVNFQRTNFIDVPLQDARFVAVDCRNTEFLCTFFQHASFERTDLSMASCKQSHFQHTKFRESCLRKVVFERGYFEETDFEQNDLEEVTFKNIDFKKCTFSGTILAKAKFKHVTFENTNCQCSIFTEAMFGKNVVLKGSDFRGAILVKAVGFAEAMLRKPLPFFEHDVNPKADCEAPQLTGAIVSKKDYEKAHLKGQGVIVYEYRYGFLEIYLRDVTSTDTESSHKDAKDLIVRFLAGPYLSG